MKKVRVLLVDDSLLFREILRELLECDGDLQVIGEAADGAEAIEKVRTLAPDLVTIDIRMPGMDGLAAIEQIMAQHPVPILVISAHPAVTRSHGVFEAIARGALEIVEKDRISERDGRGLRELVRQLAAVRVVRHLGLPPAVRPYRPTPAPADRRPPARNLVAVAASSGGPSAVAALLGALPATFPACIAVVQHLPVGFTPAFARFLREHTRLPVHIVEQPTAAEPGQVLLAPDDHHLMYGDGTFVASDDPPVGGHRPSATSLFRSLTRAATRSVGVILTGMGEDGVAGLHALRLAGGLTLAQDQKTSAVFGMPKAAVEKGAAVQALGLSELAQALQRATVQEVT